MDKLSDRSVSPSRTPTATHLWRESQIAALFRLHKKGGVCVDLNQEIQSLETQLKEIERQQDEKSYDQAEVKRLQGEWHVIRNRLSEKQLELEQLSEQEGRVQKQTEHIDGLIQNINDFGFSDLLTKREDEQIFEYEERKKNFDLILYDFIKEQQQALITAHNEEIATKDVRIRDLNTQALELNSQLTQSKQKAEALEDEVNGLEQSVRDLQEQLSQTQIRNEAQARTIDQLTGHVGELTVKLDQAQQPKEYTVPSQSLVERMAELKDKSVKSLKDASADDLVKRWQERNPGLSLPSLGEQEAVEEPQPFRDEDSTDHPTDTGADQAGDEVETVDSFPEGSSETPVDEQGSDGPVSEVERIEALEGRVKRIEAHLGL
jgi:chromosome segregation ATPase